MAIATIAPIRTFGCFGNLGFSEACSAGLVVADLGSRPAHNDATAYRCQQAGDAATRLAPRGLFVHLGRESDDATRARRRRGGRRPASSPLEHTSRLPARIRPPGAAGCAPRSTWVGVLISSDLPMSPFGTSGSGMSGTVCGRATTCGSCPRSRCSPSLRCSRPSAGGISSRRRRDTSTEPVVVAVLVGYFFNSILPLKAGEVARVVTLKRRALDVDRRVERDRRDRARLRRPYPARPPLPDGAVATRGDDGFALRLAFAIALYSRACCPR